MVGESSINPLAVFTQNFPQFSASGSLNRNSEGTNINQTNITQGENTQITDTNVLNTLAPFYERNRIDPNRDGKGEELSLLATNAMEDIYKRALTENRSLTAQESYDVSQYQKQIAVAQNFMKNSEAANKEWQIYGLGNDGLASSG